MDVGSLIREFWLNVLNESGFATGARRKKAIVKFIIDNDLLKIEHLRHADHPRGWVGAAKLSGSELEGVWALRKMGRARSRCDSRIVCCGLCPPLGVWVQVATTAGAGVGSQPHSSSRREEACKRTGKGSRSHGRAPLSSGRQQHSSTAQAVARLHSAGCIAGGHQTVAEICQERGEMLDGIRWCACIGA